jgi:hypothetical protein
MPLSSEVRKKRLQSLDEIMGQSLDEQIKEYKASAKVSLAIQFDRSLPLLGSVPKIEIYRKHLSTVFGRRCLIQH